MKWTKRKPTKPGFYLLTYEGYTNPDWVELRIEDGRGLICFTNYRSVSTIHGLWFGPIPEPKDDK